MAGGKPGRPAKYTQEFKDNAVEYYRATGKTQREAAEDLGVPPRTLGKWVQASGATDEQRRAADEARELRRENERLREENEFLKKATAFFAAGQR